MKKIVALGLVLALAGGWASAQSYVDDRYLNDNLPDNQSQNSAASESYYNESGTSYIDYDDDSYTTRMRRFSAPFYSVGYWGSIYSPYYYDPFFMDPFYSWGGWYRPGLTISFGFGPYWSSGWGTSMWMGYRPFGWGWGYSPFVNPYFGWGSGYGWGGGYWNGYYAGFYDGIGYGRGGRYNPWNSVNYGPRGYAHSTRLSTSGRYASRPSGTRGVGIAPRTGTGTAPRSSGRYAERPGSSVRDIDAPIRLNNGSRSVENRGTKAFDRSNDRMIESTPSRRGSNLNNNGFERRSSTPQIDRTPSRNVSPGRNISPSRESSPNRNFTPSRSSSPSRSFSPSSSPSRSSGGFGSGGGGSRGGSFGGGSRGGGGRGR